jgi:secondary thiamine-phosphate synthase enzyme
MQKFSIRTSKQVEMLDITAQVRGIVSKSGVKSGLCTVFVPHTTAGVTINENADTNVVGDIVKEINKIVPFKDNYMHIEGNSAAHIKASLFGFSQQVILEDGELVLGTWQGVYFCEFDGPRQRQVYIKIIEG